MGRFLAITAMGILLSASSALAADVKLAWKGHVNAEGYRIYKSADGGGSWRQVGADVPQPVPFPEDAKVTATAKNVEEDTGVIFRVSAFRGAEEVMRHDSGVWYDHRFSPPNVSEISIP